MTITKTTMTKTFDHDMTPEQLAAWLELDEPTAADRARYAAIDALLSARQAEGPINGRAWTGVWVGAHDADCICNACVSEQDCEDCAVACGLPRSTRGRQLVSNVARPHKSAECPGNCRSHPLLTREALAFRALEDQGLSWGDILEMDRRAALAAETSAQTAARLKAEAVAEAAAEAGIVRYSVTKKAEKWCGKGGAMKFRVPRPCKYASLFASRTCAGCGSHVPEGQTKCAAKKGHLVCGESLAGCWAHEKSHSCIYVHPDEEQWADACSGALCYDRERQVFHLRGDVVAPPPRDFRGLGSASRHDERRAAPSPLARPRRPANDGW